MRIIDTMDNETTLAALLADNPEAVAYDAGGFPLDLEDAAPWERADIRDGRVALIWACEADAEDDDGARTIAEVLED